MDKIVIGAWAKHTNRQQRTGKKAFLHSFALDTKSTHDKISQIHDLELFRTPVEASALAMCPA